MPWKYNPFTDDFDYYPAPVAETDPVFLASEAANFTTGDKDKLDGIAPGAVADHGALTGLTYDDHVRYFDKDGSKAATGNFDFAKYKAIAMCCDNGTSFPASPNTGQWFYRTDIDTLFIYEGAWQALHSFGAVTLYVDKTNGTDAVGQGYSSGSGATKTIQYAINLIPPVNGGNVTINVTGESYSENLVFQGKSFSGNFTITLQGAAYSVTATGAVDSGTAGTDSTQGTLTDAGAFTGLSLGGKILYVNSTYRVIDSNTDDVITFVGKIAATPAGTYSVYDWSTIITAASGITLDLPLLQKGIIVNDIKVSHSANGNVVECIEASGVTFNRCWINGGYLTTFRHANLLLNDSYISGYTASGSQIARVGAVNGFMLLSRCKLLLGAANQWGGYVIGSSTCNVRNGTIIDGGSQSGSFGIKIYLNGAVDFTRVNENPRVRNCTTGIYVFDGGKANTISDIQFSGNTTDYVLYIDSGFIAYSTTGRLYFVGTGHILYGSMYGNNISQTVTVSATDTHYEVGGSLSDGGSNGFTFQNSKELKCLVAGKYKVDYSISCDIATANQEIESSVMINSTAQTNTTAHSNLITASKPITMGGTGIITLAVNDVVKLCLANHTATNNIVVDHANLTLTQVGG